MPTRSELSEVEDGHTELMRAALEGDTGSVQKLLAGGADVNGKDGEGRTALMFAVTNLHSDTARELLEHGADVNATAHDGTNNKANSSHRDSKPCAKKASSFEGFSQSSIC